MPFLTKNKILNVSYNTSDGYVSFDDYQGNFYGSYVYEIFDANGDLTIDASLATKTQITFTMPTDFLLSKKIVMKTKSENQIGTFNLIAQPNNIFAVNFLMNYDLSFLKYHHEFETIGEIFVESQGFPREIRLIIDGHGQGAVDSYQISFAIQEEVFIP